jgi:hypothetical protein
MKPLRHRALSFALQFVPLFVVTLLAYTFIVPGYQKLVLGTSNAITEQLSPRMRIDVKDDGGWQLFVRSDRGRPKPRTQWDAFVPHLVLLGLAVLPALLLATPVPIPTRLKMLGIALPLLFLTQVASVTLLVWGTQCLREAPGTFYCLWILRVVYTSGQISAAVLWALLTWRFWFPGPVAPKTA